MSLGLAPLAGLAVRPSGALVERGAAYLHRHGLLLAHYRSLRRFKEKFQPRWEPRYLLTPEVSRVPQVTAALLVALDGNWRTMALDAWHGRRKKNLDTTGPTLDLE